MNVYAKLVILGILFTGVSVATAQAVNGTLRVVKGDVQIKSGKTGETTKAKIGQQVFAKDMVITGAESRAKIVMVDNNEINVSPDSRIEIQHYEFDPNAGKKDVLLNVLYGKVRAKVEQHYDGKTSKFQVKTPSAVAGVRGTDFMTSYNQQQNSSQVVTFRGAVEFGTPGPGGSIANSVSVTPGKTATSVAGGAPSQPTTMSKGQLVKMDNDSRADGSSSGNSQRSPSGENNKGGNGNNGNGASNSGGDNSRSPASTGPNAGGASGGGSALLPQDTVGGNGGTIVTQANGTNQAPVPLMIPPPPTNFQQPICTLCSQIIQTGNTNLTVHIISH